MENRGVLKITLLFFYLFYSINSHSQNSLETKPVYKWFDSKIGIGNSQLYNGYSYVQKFRTLKGNNEFYLNLDFLNSEIIYNDEVFYDVDLKYDVFHDEVIVRLPNGYSFNYIRLVKEKVKNFTVNNIQFLFFSKNDLKKIPEIKSGFYEVLFQKDDLSLFIKHTKNRFEKLDRDYLYNEFKEHESYFILNNEQWYVLKSKNDVTNIFVDHRNEVKSFYRKNRRLKKDNYHEFLKRLISYMNNLKMNKNLIKQ